MLSVSHSFFMSRVSLLNMGIGISSFFFGARCSVGSAMFLLFSCLHPPIRSENSIRFLARLKCSFLMRKASVLTLYTPIWFSVSFV